MQFPSGPGSLGCSEKDLPQAMMLKGAAPGRAGADPLRNGSVRGVLLLVSAAAAARCRAALTPLIVKPHLAFVGLGSGNCLFSLLFFSQRGPDGAWKECWEGGTAVRALSSSSPVMGAGSAPLAFPAQHYRGNVPESPSFLPLAASFDTHSCPCPHLVP